MRVFDVVSGEPVIDPSRLIIPEFKKLWSRDKTKDKSKVTKEIAYIVFSFDLSIDNPYRGFPEYERDSILKKDLFDNVNWEPDNDVKAAMDKFRLLMETTTTRLLSAAKQAADKLADWYRQVDFKERDEDGKLLFTVKELSSSLKDLGGTIRSLDMLEEMVRRGQLDNTSTRGGSDIGMYEMRRNDFDYGV